MVCIPRDGGPDTAPKMPKHDLRFLDKTFMPNPLCRERAEMILGQIPTQGASPHILAGRGLWMWLETFLQYCPAHLHRGTPA